MVTAPMWKIRVARVIDLTPLVVVPLLALAFVVFLIVQAFQGDWTHLIAGVSGVVGGIIMIAVFAWVDRTLGR